MGGRKWRDEMVAPIGSGAEHRRRTHCLLRATPATAPGRGRSTPSYRPAATTQVDVRSVPRTVLSRCSEVSPQNGLLKHLIGTGEDRGRNSDPKFLRRLQIDEEFEVRGQFRW